jgi:hypothetical protein
MGKRVAIVVGSSSSGRQRSQRPGGDGGGSESCVPHCYQWVANVAGKIVALTAVKGEDTGKNVEVASESVAGVGPKTESGPGEGRSSSAGGA